MAGKLGKLPASTKPALRFAVALTDEAAAAVPDTKNWDAGLALPMLGNDQYGDCVEAAMGHHIETWTAAAQGTEAAVTLADILGTYSKITGFDPNDPNTDQGTVIQDALNWWRKNPVAGKTILFFAKVDHSNPAELAAAQYYFGQINWGFNVPQSAMDQFDAGKPWDVVKNDGGIIGGHSVGGGGYDLGSKVWTVATWGTTQTATQAFMAKYADEAWVIGTQDWLDAHGMSPSGLDLPALGAEFASLTGDPNPVPNPGPTPPPPPGPRVSDRMLFAATKKVQAAQAEYDAAVAQWAIDHHVA